MSGKSSTKLNESVRHPTSIVLSILILAALAWISANSPPCWPGQSRIALGTHRVIAWQYVEDFHQPLAQFETVFWEPRDTESLRLSIRDTQLVRGKSILEIGTGTGLVALCCLQAGADQVVATDVNSAALANARWNAQSLGLADRFDTRFVPLENSSAYTVIDPNERFDLIISNPPWEDQVPNKIDEFALYDAEFKLLGSIVGGASQHLKPGGRVFLAYRTVKRSCGSRNLRKNNF